MKIDLASLEISLVEGKDIEYLAQYRVDYLAELYGFMPSGDSKTIKCELIDYFKKSIKDETFVGLQAKLNEDVVAYAGMIIKQIPGDFNQSIYREAEILNMYTIPEFRNQGVGSLMLKEIFRIAKTKSISKIALHTTSDAEGLYRNFGFEDPEYPYLELKIETNEP